jgi:RHS repeat-associated protein
MPKRAFKARSIPSLAVLLLILVSCGPVTPTATIGPSGAPKPPGLRKLDECDPGGLVACNQQAAFLTIPIADTGVALTYSSQWAPGRKDRPGWDASPLGLGGWSLDVVQRYDAAKGILVGGDGSWRYAKAVPAGSGKTAVPTYDGTIAYVFDAAGRHVRTVDGHLGTVLLTIAYDPAGRLMKADGTVNGQAAHLSVKRSDDGAPTALVGTDGATTALELDWSGNLIGVIDPASATTQLAWAAGGLITSETDALGGVTRFTYDGTGRLVAATDADGVTQQLSQTATATRIEIRASSAQGRISTYRSESVGGGVRRTFIGPDGATTTETAAPDGSRSVTLPDGTSRSVGAVPSASWGLAAPIQTPDVETRPDGVVSRSEVEQNLSASGGLPYDLSGSIKTTVNGQTWVRKFDAATRTATLVDPVGRKSIQSFDAGGRLVASSAPGRAPIKYTYDAMGREASERLGTGALAQTTRFSYDASTGRIRMTRPDGKTETRTVDAAGRATTTTAPDGSTIVEAHDAAGRPTQVQPPGGLSFTFGTSPAGRPTAFLPPAVGTDASVETARYDSDGNLVAVSGLGTRTMSAAHDAAGRIIGWTFDQGKTTAAYDPSSGLRTQTADPGGVMTAYGYAGSLPDKLAWSGPLNGSVAITLDANGRAAAETVDGSAAMSLAYDGSGDLTGVGGLSLTRDPASGLVTRVTLGAVQTDQQYDANDRLVRGTTTASGKVVLDLRYSRDALGRITTAVETGPDRPTAMTTYAYDGVDRLAQVQVGGRTVETDSYDAAGDRTTVTSSTGTTKATYDARDRLVSWGTATYSWAPDGNLTRRSHGAGSASFTFDDFGRLRGVTLPDGRAVTYFVDADGRRVGREVNGKLVAGYLYDLAGHVVAETDGSGAVEARFGYDDLGHLTLVERGASSYRVVSDPVGSPRRVIDSQSGAIVDAIDYDAWGRITSETTPGTIPFGFGGGLQDPDTGLVHLGARDYDPTTGRWTGADPSRFAGDDPNLYRYSGGDPVNHVDPTGLCTDWQWTGKYLLVGSYGPLLGSTLSNLVPCDPTPPPPPPGSPPPPPGPPPGGGSGPSCTGVACAFPGGTGCINGTCSNGPNGFSCRAEACNGPNGLVCIGTEAAPCSIGDTHLYTGDGVHVDFQAAGEFVAQMSPDGKVEVQARQEPILGDTLVTFNTAVAANVAGDRVGVYAKEPSFLRINGVAVDAPDIAEQLPHGGTLERHGGLVTVGWPDGSRLTITRVANTLNYRLRPASAVGPTLRGLLGSADRNPTNDLTGRDGIVLDRADPAFNTKLYEQFGNSWRITQKESLFDYGPGESTRSFTHLAIPTSTATVGSLSASVRRNAEAICRAVGVQAEPTLDDCILDVGMTGDPAFAASEAAVAAAGAQATGIVSRLVLGQAVSATIGSSTQHDDYTFSATAGDIVYPRAQGTCIAGLQWALLRPNGAIQDFAPSCRDIGREVLAGGTWTVRIYSDGTATGAYAFTVLAVPALSVDQLIESRAVTGAVSQIGAWYEYTFSAGAGDIVYLQAHGSCVPGLQWALLRPNGAIQDFAPSCRDLGRVVLGAPGIWIVRAYSEGTATGAYSFTVLPVPAPVTSGLVIGQTVSGSIGQIGQWQDYTFSAKAGDIVFVHAQGTCIAGLQWALLRPNGAIQYFAPSCRDIGREVLAGGTWTVRIYSDGTATGAYQFTVSASS